MRKVKVDLVGVVNPLRREVLMYPGCLLAKPLLEMVWSNQLSDKKWAKDVRLMVHERKLDQRESRVLGVLNDGVFGSRYL